VCLFPKVIVFDAGKATTDERRDFVVSVECCESALQKVLCWLASRFFFLRLSCGVRQPVNAGAASQIDLFFPLFFLARQAKKEENYVPSNKWKQAAGTSRHQRQELITAAGCSSSRSGAAYAEEETTTSNNNKSTNEE